jgi:hypothetical protein
MGLMPDNLKELHKYIWDKTEDNGISRGVALYAVGWIFYDIFERIIHHEQSTGVPITPDDIDRFVRDLPPAKIDRDIYDAQQAFGQDAFEFMEEDTEKRIREGIENSVVAVVRNFTSGWKAFGMNVIAGVVAGVIFAAVSLALYFYVKVDPSPNSIGKNAIEKSEPSSR